MRKRADSIAGRKPPDACRLDCARSAVHIQHTFKHRFCRNENPHPAWRSHRVAGTLASRSFTMPFPFRRNAAYSPLRSATGRPGGERPPSPGASPPASPGVARGRSREGGASPRLTLTQRVGAAKRDDGDDDRADDQHRAHRALDFGVEMRFIHRRNPLRPASSAGSGALRTRATSACRQGCRASRRSRRR